jgi:hypothetical protein
MANICAKFNSYKESQHVVHFVKLLLEHGVPADVVDLLG